MIDFAILAPVPEMHLKSAADVAAAKGYVSFGSQKFMLFREVDSLRGGQEVPVLIYPSHSVEETEAKLTYTVAWSAWYVGHVQDNPAKLDDEKAGHRPATTFDYYKVDSYQHWGVFWRVRDLKPLPLEHQHRIRELASDKTGHWRANAAPRGPEMVSRPDWI